MENSYRIMVSIYCITFNQIKFIRQCLDGFISQKTSFDFEVVIHDDNSTDGTRQVVEEYAYKYPNIIKPIYEDTNVYAIDGFRGIHNIILPFIRGKYVAMCEGDDYWIDPCKLQKQFDFMEENPEYMLCFHAINEVYEGRPELNKQRANVENREYSGIEWYKNRPSQTSSYFFRRDVYESDLYKNVINNERFRAADVPLLLTCANYGKIRGMSEVMSVYRRTPFGWTESVKTDEQYWKIVNSQLEYKIFGPEYEKVSKFFYVDNCCNIFLSILNKQHKIRLGFLVAAIRVLPLYAIKCLFRAIFSKIKQ